MERERSGKQSSSGELDSDAMKISKVTISQLYGRPRQFVARWFAEQLMPMLSALAAYRGSTVWRA